MSFIASSLKKMIIGAFVLTMLIGGSVSLAGNISKDRHLSRSMIVENLEKTITQLEGYGERYSHKKQWEAAYWLKSRFDQKGIENWIETYEYDAKQWPNVIGKIPGKEKTDEVIMLIAHLDSWSDKIPGANDNASGVAVLSECVRLVQNIKTKRSIYFAVFSNEEQGARGSRAFAEKARKEEMRIQAVINLDILGYNRPKYPIYWEYWDALWSHHSWRAKARAFYLMLMNYATGIVEGDNVLLIAGKPPNQQLGEIVAMKVREISNLKTQEKFREDCA